METIGMLDHQKIILEKVTENNETFLKELKKSLKWLSTEDRKLLFSWLKENYWDSHKPEIEAVFKMEFAA